MSFITDSLKLLKKESAAFAFLPGINCFYLYWKSQSPGIEQALVTVLALFVSATVFNILTQVDFSQYVNSKEKDEESSDSEILGPVSLIIILVLFLSWVLIFGASLVGLWNQRPTGAIWPLVLIGVSIVIVSLLVSDIILTMIFPAYSKT